MSSDSSPQSVPVAERLMAWVDDVQLSARVGFPHYANPGELKTDIRSLVEQLELLKDNSPTIGAAYLRLKEQLEARQRLVDEAQFYFDRLRSGEPALTIGIEQALDALNPARES